MKNKYNGGYTLVELLVSIVILAAIVIPTCTSLVLSYRMNAKTEDMMQAQLAVSSAVETLMAEGIDANRVKDIKDHNENAAEIKYDFAWDGEKSKMSEIDDYPNVSIIIEQEEGVTAYYNVTVTDDEALVEVTTQIRVAKGGS